MALPYASDGRQLSESAFPQTSSSLSGYSKRLARKTKADESSRHKGKADGSNARSIKSVDNPEVAPLKQSAAVELGISIEQLDRLSAEEIEELAMEKGLI